MKKLLCLICLLLAGCNQQKKMLKIIGYSRGKILLIKYQNPEEKYPHWSTSDGFGGSINGIDEIEVKEIE